MFIIYYGEHFRKNVLSKHQKSQKISCYFNLLFINGFQGTLSTLGYSCNGRVLYIFPSNEKWGYRGYNIEEILFFKNFPNHFLELLVLTYTFFLVKNRFKSTH